MGRQRGRGQARALRIAKRPVGYACIKARCRLRGQYQLVLRIGHQHQRQTAKVALYRRLPQLRHLFALQGTREIARELEQRLRPALAAARYAGLKAQPGRKLAGQQTQCPLL